MEDAQLIGKEDYQKKKDSIVSIIGIGGKACRIVDNLQKMDLLDTDIHAFVMHKPELDELSLLHKHLIDPNMCREEKNKTLAKEEFCKLWEELNNVVNHYLSCFVVCLGDATIEDYLEIFLQKAIVQDSKIKILVVTLPHSSEGSGKRRNSLDFLKRVEELVDGIFVVDYDSFHTDSLSETIEKGNKRVFEIVYVWIGSIVKIGMLSFDMNSMHSFLCSEGSSKYVEHFSLSGNLNDLKQVLEERYIFFLSKKYSVNAISNMVLLAQFNSNPEEILFKTFLEDVVLRIMRDIDNEAKVDWGLYNNPNREVNNYRLDLFIKYKL